MTFYGTINFNTLLNDYYYIVIVPVLKYCYYNFSKDSVSGVLNVKEESE